MSRLESIRYRPHRCTTSGSHIEWRPLSSELPEKLLPQIFWRDGRSWREANLWLLERSEYVGNSYKTVKACAEAIQAYATWLEDYQIDWAHFPMRKADRCLNRYRGFLIRERAEKRLAPSTVSHRMRMTIRLYRWFQEQGILNKDNKWWREQGVGIRTGDIAGFERTIYTVTTDLSIPNRRPPGSKLEDGLLPLTPKARDEILAFVKTKGSEELFLILSTAFFTGMRLGTLSDLRIETLHQAVRDPNIPHLYRLNVGPRASPPVATKFSVTGQIWIPETLLSVLLGYAESTRRLKREIRATTTNKNLLFLTRYGNPYALRGDNKSPAINVEMHDLRKKAEKYGLEHMATFHFHQTRCTFATELAKIAIKAGGALNAVAIVRDALLHRDESTSIRYIRFIEQSQIKEEAANQFTKEFLGVLHANTT